MSSRSKVVPIIPHFAEDCLTLNVVTPTDASPTSNLPVLVWIYGGAFEIGGTGLYNGSSIVEKAISLSVPVIYVSMNYRMNAFGFLASQEVKDAGVGNLGLHDQRLALRWVQRYIRDFGGDPAKVTIWGESAGAISVAFHMITNDGNSDGLFRAAIMQSGSTIPIKDITYGQPYYDALVAATECSGFTDTLQCLREAPYKILLDAMNQSPGILSYQSVDLAWMPRMDGVFLKANPQYLVQQGSVTNIPFISSNCDDEGTLFSLSSLNITTDAQFEEYIHTYFVPNASPDELKQLMSHYPSDPALGSPFGTGNKNVLTPQFKRIAAFQGDFTFQAPRRFFIQNLSGKQSIWTYVSKRGKFRSPIGAAHASDLAYVYGGGDIASYLLRFVTYLDPNVGEITTDLYWPQYDAKFSPIMLEFLDGFIQQDLTTDTYRAEAIAYLIDLTLANWHA
ncbi:Alpha/Beta hydrolase protein [Chiua virens]|nr:Alpha/Beta hydrolase protein [Chiua virens]